MGGTEEKIQKWLVELTYIEKLGDLTYTEKLCLSKAVLVTAASVTC